MTPLTDRPSPSRRASRMGLWGRSRSAFAMEESATALLKDDHRVIEKMLGALEGAATRMARGAEVPKKLLEDALEFSQTFVDRCHHGKEEACLFPCLEKKGIPNEGGPIGVMLREHQMGREMANRVRVAMQQDVTRPEVRAELARLCREYVDHLRGHIFKEENILFSMGESVMDRDDHESSVRCYEQTEEERVGESQHREMVALAERLDAANEPE